MTTHHHLPHIATRSLVGLLAGAAIVAVDNFAFEGEVSPVVIAAMLLVATLAMGIAWGRGAWAAGFITAACIPLAHLVKHVLGLPDTLHPNTYTSIAWLAVFTLVVATVGTSTGVILYRMGRESSRSSRRRHR
jgi:hypothetical protein